MKPMEKLTNDEMDRLALMFEISPRLADAYRVKNEFLTVIRSGLWWTMRSFCNGLMPSDTVHLSRAELEEVYRDALVRIALLEQQLQEEQEQFDELLDSFTQLYGDLYG